MTMKKSFTEKNQALANEIRDFLTDHRIGMDVRVYFNGKCYEWYDSTTKKYTKEPLLIENIRPSEYFGYADDDTVSMSFEGFFYDMMNYGENGLLKKRFDEIFERHNCFYELGNHWNLSVSYY